MIEEQRTIFNNTIDADITAEQSFQTEVNGYKAQVLAVTSQWPTGWEAGPLYTPNAAIVLQALRDIDAAITASQSEVTRLQGKKADFNDAIDSIVVGIYITMIDSGNQDANGDPIMLAYYQNDELYLPV